MAESLNFSISKVSSIFLISCIFLKSLAPRGSTRPGVLSAVRSHCSDGKGRDAAYSVGCRREQSARGKIVAKRSRIGKGVENKQDLFFASCAELSRLTTRRACFVS